LDVKPRDCSAKKPGIDLKQNMSPDSCPHALSTYQPYWARKTAEVWFSKELKEMNVVLVDPDCT
jgi:hypothetical protein